MPGFTIVRLKGLSEEVRDTMNTPEWPGAEPKPAKRREIVARLEGFDLFTSLFVLAELVGDAKIGDEFEIRLEPVKK